MTTNVKLINHSRDQIVSNAMKGAFEKEYAANKKRMSEHAMRCYRSLVTPAQEKKARQAPDEFLCLSNVARIDYYVSDTKWDGCETDLDLGRVVPFPARSACLTIRDPKLLAERDAINQEKRSIDNKREELKTSLRRTVYSTSSLKKLIEMWPEVENFLPEYLTAPKPMLPALPVGDLNNALRAAGVKVGVIVKPKATGGLVAVAA
jgi:hypothetical protein